MTTEEFLFAPFRSGILGWPGQEDKTLFLNAFPCPDLRKISGEKTLQSFSFRRTKALEKAGFSCTPAPEGRFDAVLLAAHLPSSLSGASVDFGCGYGFLSCFALHHCQNIENLIALDDD